MKLLKVQLEELRDENDKLKSQAIEIERQDEHVLKMKETEAKTKADEHNLSLITLSTKSNKEIAELVLGHALAMQQLKDEAEAKFSKLINGQEESIKSMKEAHLKEVKLV